jgi:hypothetical protein
MESSCVSTAVVLKFTAKPALRRLLRPLVVIRCDPAGCSNFLSLVFTVFSINTLAQTVNSSWCTADCNYPSANTATRKTMFRIRWVCMLWSVGFVLSCAEMASAQERELVDGQRPCETRG